MKNLHSALTSVILFWCLLTSSSRAQAQASQDPDELAAAGQQALAAGQYPTAQAAFQKLAALEPNVAEVHATLGVIDFKLRDYEHAVTEVRRARALKPGLPRLDSLLGLSLAELGQFKEALPGLEKGFQQNADPSTKRLCGLQLLRAYTGLERDAEAVTTALELTRLYPDDAEILYHTGRIYGNFAFLQLHKLEVVAPTSVWRHQAAAEAFESEGSTNASVGEYREVLKLDPRRPKIHYRIGRTLLARWQQNHAAEDRDNAAKEFAEELQMNPGDANAIYELGEIHRQANELDQARQLFESALQEYPDFQEAQVGLAATLIAQQKPDLARPHLQKAVEINPEDEVAWYRLAQVDRSLGNAEEQKKALAEFQRLRSQIALQRGTNTPAEVTKQALQPGDVQ